MPVTTAIPTENPTLQTIALQWIQRDDELQMREQLDDKHIEILMEVIEQGNELQGRPPVVFYDGLRHWLADGYHRYAAHERCGIAEMKCEVIAGSFEDAKLFAASANATHGKRLDEHGIKKAVLTLMGHPFAKWWTAGQIASQVGCSKCYVSKIIASHPILVMGEKDIPEQLSDDIKDKIRQIIQGNGVPRIFTNKYGTWSVLDVASARDHAAKARKGGDQPNDEQVPADGQALEQTVPQEGATHDGTVQPGAEVYRDAKGRICIRPELIEAFKILPSITEVMEAVHGLYLRIQAIMNGPGGAGINARTVLDAFIEVMRELREGRPHAICPIETDPDNESDWHARQEQCIFCQNRRWMSFGEYEAMQANMSQVVKQWAKFRAETADQ